MNTLAIHKDKARRILVCVAISFGLVVYSLYLFSKCNSRAFLLISLFFIPLILCGCFFLQKQMDRGRIVAAFCVAACALGTVMCFLFPPLAVPDEFYHYQSSYWYADSLMGSASIFDASEFPMRSVDLAMSEEHLDGQVSNKSFKSIISDFELLSSNTSFEMVAGRSYDLGSNPPQLKIASALGIVIARVFDLGAYPLFYLGRFFNMLFYIALTAGSIRVIPFGKKILAAVAMLPMSLHLASSYSYDAGILGLSFLFTSLCVRAIYTEGKMDRREGIAIGLAGILLAPCKVVYSLLAALLFLIPASRFSSKRIALGYKFGICAMMLSVILALRIPTLLSMAGLSGPASVQSHDGVTGQYFTVASVLSNPVGSAAMFVRTLFDMADFYWYSLVGGTLGTFQGSIAAPKYFSVILIGILALAALRSSDDDMVLGRAGRALGITIFVAGFCAVLLSLWVGWTFTTDIVIQGVQGRYFLPLLPLLLLSVRPIACRVDVETFSIVVKSLYALDLMYVLYILAFGLATI